MYYNDYNRPNNQWDVPGDPMLTANQNPMPEPPAPPHKKGKLWPKVVALCLCCALLGGTMGAGGALLLGNLGGRKDTTTLYQGDRAPTVVNVSKMGTDKILTIPEVYASNVGSVVGITVDFVTTNYFGQTVKLPAAGSGFVISTDGYIVTNYHVISYNGQVANSIKVTFSDGTSYDAEFIGGQEENDVAVLKAKNASGLTPVIIGSSDDMKVGEAVVAIGNPLGELTFTLTEGVVSAKDRNISMSDGTIMNMIQTNAAINSGNSGGPLFNTYGEVIGITSAKFSNNGSAQASIEGIGFAIPINDVVDLIKDIMTHGYVTGKPYLGIKVSTVGSDAQQYGVPAGAYVAAVAPSACSGKAGLQVGDVVTAIGDVKVDSADSFITEKNKYKAGDTMVLTVNRSGTEQKISIVLDESTPALVSAANAELEKQAEEQQKKMEEEAKNNPRGQSGQQYSGGTLPWPFGDMFGW